jgi:hypothetical protein
MCAEFAETYFQIKLMAMDNGCLDDIIRSLKDDDFIVPTKTGRG